MNIRHLLILFVLLWGTACGASAQKSRQLLVLQTSDTHSRIDPIDPASADPNAGRGGVVRRTALVRQYRERDPELLLFDCGDISQGTPYYNLFQGEVEVQAMNLMGYDAMTIGNHEFDFGLENMARLFRMARFPVVCANYDVTGTVLEGLVKPYVVLERQGLRIGVFGLGTRLEGLVQQSKCEGVVYHDPVETARRVVEKLRREEKCDVVICLSHLGILSGDAVGKGYDNELVRETSGIDLILGGHTHTYMEHPTFYRNAKGRETPVLHSGKSGIYVGEVRLILKREKERKKQGRTE